MRSSISISVLFWSCAPFVFQALAEQQKAQQLAQQQAGAPPAGTAPGQVPAPAAGQVPQASAVAGAAAVPNAAVLVRIQISPTHTLRHQKPFQPDEFSSFCFF